MCAYGCGPGATIDNGEIPTIKTGGIEGTVKDGNTNKLLSDVYVTIAGARIQTSSDGYYKIESLPVGTYEVIISKVNYAYKLEKIIVRENLIVNFNIILNPEIIDNNSVPIANAGQDKVTQINREILLSGVDSYDIDGDILTYRWDILTSPMDSTARLITANDINTKFTPDKIGEYTLKLNVSDGKKISSDRINIIVNDATNTPPVSIIESAYGSSEFLSGEVINLFGSKSYDLDNDTITYVWELIYAPIDSTIDISLPNNPNAQLTPDVAGDYVIGLTVSDDYGGNTSYFLASVKNTITIKPNLWKKCNVGTVFFDSILQWENWSTDWISWQNVDDGNCWIKMSFYSPQYFVKPVVFITGTHQIDGIGDYIYMNDGISIYNNGYSPFHVDGTTYPTAQRGPVLSNSANGWIVPPIDVSDRIIYDRQNIFYIKTSEKNSSGGISKMQIKIQSP
jgi:hypothetical protein